MTALGYKIVIADSGYQRALERLVQTRGGERGYFASPDPQTRTGAATGRPRAYPMKIWRSLNEPKLCEAKWRRA